MIAFPNCKINLGLSVLSKRPDGFHDIETVFYPVGLCDALEIVPSPDDAFRFAGSGLSIPGDPEDNLVVKAHQLLKDVYQIPEVHIHLHKKIPFGAGLGGGSSDAAYALHLLNELFQLQLSEVELMNHARKLGADCAFFIRNLPSYAFDRGDHFTDIEINLAEYYLVLVKPQFGVGTSEAYASVRPGVKETSIREIINLPIEEWKAELVNDFEDAVFGLYPEIKEIKDKLYDGGAVYASMSGSGSAVYGLFKSQPNIGDVFPNCFIWQESLK